MRLDDSVSVGWGNTAAYQSCFERGLLAGCGVGGTPPAFHDLGEACAAVSAGDASVSENKSAVRDFAVRDFMRGQDRQGRVGHLAL